MKKAISTLIATVLLIGFTVALAAVIMTWGSGFTKKIIKESEETSEEKMALIKYNINLRDGIYDKSNGLLKFSIENIGDAKIMGLKIRIYGSDDTFIVDSSEVIEEWGVKFLTIPYDINIGDIVKLEVFPIYSINNKLVTSFSPAHYSSFLEETIQIIPTQGLIAYWNFDEGSGTTATDSAGTNHGTVYGATWVDGKSGKALSFDGRDDYVSVPDSNSLDITEWTIAFWTKLNARNNADPYGFVIKGRDTFENFEVLIAYNGQYFQLPIKFTDGGRTWLDTSPIEIGQWTYIAYSYSSSQGRRFYINGILSASDAESRLPQVNDRPLFIGNEERTDRYLNGILDEVRIYNRALSAEEVQNLYSGIAY